MFRRAILSKNKFGQMKSGVEKTPDILKEYLHPHTEVYSVSQCGNLFEHLNELYLKNKSINKDKVVNLGGDHSMTIATGAHSLNNYSNTKFIWIDAHPDINTFTSSETKNFHGMPLAYLCGLFKHQELQFLHNYLPFENILYIGIRDIDSFESKIIREKNISYITPSDCIDIIYVINKIKNFIGDNPVHLSFDVDSLDPLYIKSTGTPVANGLSIKTTKTIINEILTNHNVINIDITELNLQQGCEIEQRISLINVLDVCEDVFK